jgi:DnaK suppressor protein
MKYTKFKEMLLKNKDEINLYIKNHPREIDFEGDETDIIQAKILARSAAQIIARNQENLIKIEIALKKIAEGSFGVCEECGDGISEKRLMFNPGFNSCISCAEELELLKKNQVK